MDALTDWRQVVINGNSFKTNDQKQSGRDLLGLAGLSPASEFVLVLVSQNRTRLIGLDDKVDLRVEKDAVFRAFESDRVYTWTLDEIGQIWGTETLEVNELIGLFSINEDQELVLEREHEPDVVLRPGGSVSFAQRGTEDIVTRRKRPDVLLVTVFTTAGVFPSEGALRVPPDTLVQNVLERAARKLDLKDTTNWVVTADGRDIDPSRSFAQNGLTGIIELDWSPREGGGGHA